jgi:RsiW-degrading membrane proteinase PrsW (M82 family)
MLILTHVIIALTSIAFSGLTAVMPSHTKLRASYGLVVATLVSGTWLVVATHSPLLSACVTGLVYLGITLGALVLAHRRLVAAE